MISADEIFSPQVLMAGELYRTILSLQHLDGTPMYDSFQAKNLALQIVRGEVEAPKQCTCDVPGKLIPVMGGMESYRQPSFCQLHPDGKSK